MLSILQVQSFSPKNSLKRIRGAVGVTASCEAWSGMSVNCNLPKVTAVWSITCIGVPSKPNLLVSCEHSRHETPQNLYCNHGPPPTDRSRQCLSDAMRFDHTKSCSRPMLPSVNLILLQRLSGWILQTSEIQYPSSTLASKSPISRLVRGFPLWRIGRHQLTCTYGIVVKFATHVVSRPAKSRSSSKTSCKVLRGSRSFAVDVSLLR